MSRPFEGGFICDLCHAHLDEEFYGMLIDVDGELLDVCSKCVEDNAVEVA